MIILVGSLIIIAKIREKEKSRDNEDSPKNLRRGSMAGNLPSGTRRNRIPDEVKAAILRDMEAGMSGAEAARKYGVSSSTCNNLYRMKYGYRR